MGNKTSVTRLGFSVQLANLAPMLTTRPIDWELIAQQYDQLVKYATALRLGTAEAEQSCAGSPAARRNTPTYRALEKLGRATKTILLCE